MDPDTTSPEQDDEDLAFEAAFASEDGPASEPAQAPTPAPSDEPATASAAPGAAAQAGQGEQPAAVGQEDELAALPPRLRAAFERMERAMPALDQVNDLAQRVRKQDSRIGDLYGRIPTPAPTAPPRPQLPKVDAIRRDLPEVAEALDELLEHARAAQQAPATAPAHAAASTSSDEGAESEQPTTLLDSEAPDWRDVVRGKAFDQWLASQSQQYAQRVRTTDSEPVMLAAIARFKGEQDAAARAAQAAATQAARVQQQRQARTAGAVVPTTGARRSPATSTDIEDAAFMAGFNS